ncbi:MAG: GNAT family N-acetyltransferase [Oscillospiraceae bacterium]|nr:GNAT family N-acetyltransferase [Oscillospiraceae bacterium]
MIVKILGPGCGLPAAFEIRRIVFTDEQGFDPLIDTDSIDPAAHHIVIYDNNRPIATARTFPRGSGNDLYVIGRVAVLAGYRGKGIGRIIMREAENLAARLGAKSFTVGAQIQAVSFYRKCGYTEYGGRYYEEHCEHISMAKKANR